MATADSNSDALLHLLQNALDTGVCFDQPDHEGWPLEAQTLVAAVLDSRQHVGTPRRLCIRGARIAGEVDLSGAIVSFPIVFDHCTFDRDLRLTAASLVSLRIHGGALSGFEARQLHVAGDLELSRGLQVAAPVCLRGCQLGGTLEVTDATLGGNADFALDCTDTTIGEDLVLGAHTTLGAALLLDNAHIKGNFRCKASVSHPLGVSIAANLLRVDGNVTFDEGYVCAGTVRLAGAKVGGRLHFDGGSISKGTSNDYAIDGESLAVSQNLDLDGDLTIDGPVSLPFARVGAQLCLNGIRLRACGTMAVNGQGAAVEGDVYISEGSEVFGSVDFTGANIKGDLACDHASFHDPGGIALTAERSDIGGEVFLRNSKAWGAIRFVSTHIGGDLDCATAEFHNAGGSALFARRARLDRDVVLTDGFICEGTLDLVRVVIGGALRCEDATLSAPGKKALDLRGAQIGGVLRLLPETKPDGEITLLDAKCAVLRDDEATWPEILVLDGFNYGCFDPDAPQTVEQRLRWLKRNKGGYSSRIYEQLIGVLRAAGNEEDARHVALERQWRRAARLPVYIRPLYWMWGLTVGFGYSLRRLFPWLAALLASGTAFFWAAYPAAFTPKSKPTPDFNAFVYTLDLLVPVIKLGQSDAWITSGATLYVGWIFNIVGWVLAAAIVAGLSQIVRKG